MNRKIKILLIITLIASVVFVDSCAARLEECSACDGTGKCNRCGGTGWAVDWDLECDTCDGTGDCRTCGGSGYIDKGIPGFEILLVICALSIVLFWRRKRG